MEEEKEAISKEEIAKIYEDTIEIMVNQGKSAAETKDLLIANGVEEVYAILIVAKVSEQMDPSSNGANNADKEQAYKNMAFGALWCIGGIIASAADIGVIFIGAIVIGAIQFVIGVIGVSIN